jgi:hypothetical protein
MQMQYKTITNGSDTSTLQLLTSLLLTFEVWICITIKKNNHSQNYHPKAFI